MSSLRTTMIRALSGAVYVASIVGALLCWTPAFYGVMCLYAVLVMVEFVRLRSGFAMLRRTARYQAVVFWLLAWMWIVVPFLIMIFLPRWVLPLAGATAPELLMLSLFALVWIHDSFAYLTGILLGKHLLAPAISPKKTIEGSVGGVLFTLLAGGLFWSFSQNHHPLHFWLIGAVLISIWATLGDLTQSRLKRLAGVKDSGSLMPGHGGFFDRFDALLFAAPVWLIWVWLFR
jgi:phosphatidate cytidylyltransferase